MMEPWPGISTDWRQKNNLSEETPEIVAIFKQIKNLRECDRSLRSLRRNLELDNVPTIGETVEEEMSPAPSEELDQLLDSFLELRREKDDLAGKVDELTRLVERLQSTVERQNPENYGK